MYCAKKIQQHIASYALAVFLLQFVAVGFCAPTAIASTPHMAMESSESNTHCITSGTLAQQTSHQEHACAHCDLPDVSHAPDKLSKGDFDMSAQLYVLAVVPMAFDVDIRLFTSAIPPNVAPLQTALSSFNLNLRFRI